MPVGDQPLARIESGEGAVHKGGEMGPANLIRHLPANRHASSSLSPRDLRRRGPKRRRITNSSASSGLASSSGGSVMTRPYSASSAEVARTSPPSAVTLSDL